MTRAPKKPWRYPANQRNSKPRTAYCDRCKVQVLSATYDALPVLLDPQPLSMFGEVDALVSGARTWFHAADILWKRTAWAIKTSPKGFGGTIHRDHRCPRGHPRGALLKAAAAQEFDICPF